MEESHYNVLIHIIKMPIIFLLYVLYMFFSIFVPSKYVSKLINIELIEKDLNVYFNNHLILKIIALIITILIYIFYF